MRRLIGVDWGAESFRAWHVDARGVVTDRRESGDGLRRAARRGHEKTLRRHVGGWLGPDATLIVSSAVFDRSGWIETPLPSVPAGIDTLLDNAVHRWLDETPLLVLPGLASRAPGADDVMRREALLALGAVRGVAERDGERDGRRLIVVPGTRSRWIRIDDARVTAFRTAMGGELLALLLDGAFGRTLPSGGGASEEPAFLDGVERGYRSRHPITDLFAPRAAVLLDERDADLARAELRGRVIGNEIREAEVALEATGEALTLVGDDAACEPYARALRHLGTTVARVGLETAARAGLAALGERLPPTPPHPVGDRATTDAPAIATASERRAEPLDTSPTTPSPPVPARRGFDEAFAELPLLAFLPAIEPRGVVAAATTMVEAGFRILVVSMRDESTNRGEDDATTAETTARALATIWRLSDAFGTRLCIGVRDVPMPKTALAAIDAGARVVVASGTDEALARRCAKRGIPWVPGVATVTEAYGALALGARALLLYPAELIEPRGAQALRRALPPGTPLLPAGGLTVRTLLPHAAAGASGAVADEALIRPGANRVERVAAARTFVRTWRRIERGRRALAAGATPRTAVDADGTATAPSPAPPRSLASAPRSPSPRASLVTPAPSDGPSLGTVSADEPPGDERSDDASARTPTPSEGR